MRKNNMFNRQVIKALSVAISAGMLLQPMTAMADSYNPENDNTEKNKIENKTETASTTQYDTAEGVAADTDALVEDAVSSTEAVATAILPDGDDDPNKDIKDLADEDVKDAAKALQDSLDENAEVLNNDCADTLEKFNSANDQIAEMDNQDSIIKGSISTFNSNAKTANDADQTQKNDQEKAEQLAKDTTKAVSDAQAVVNAQSKNIEGAGDVGAANAAYETAKAAVTSADKAVNDAEAAYALIEEEFNTASTTYDSAVQAAKSADQALKDAQQAYDDAKAAAIALTGGEDDQLLDGDAEARLKALEDKVTACKNASDAAYDALKDAGYGKVAVLEKQIQAKIDAGATPDFTNDWRQLAIAMTEAELFSDEAVPGTVKVTQWKTFSGNYTYEDGRSSTKGDVLNYGIVKYTDKETNKTVTRYINYKTSEGNDKKAPGIVIFEKTEHTVLDGKDLSQDTLDKLASEGIAEEKGMIIFKNAQGKYDGYDLAAGVEDIKVTEDTNATDGVTVSIDSEHAVTTYAQVDGKLVKTVTANVTTTTFTENNLAAAEATLAQESLAQDAYKTALQTKINDLKDGEVLVVKDADGNETEFAKGSTATLAGYKSVTDSSVVSAGYEVSATYTEKFTKTAHIEGTLNHGRITDERASEAYYDAADSQKNTYKKTYEFDDTILDFDGYQTHYYMHGIDVSDPTIRQAGPNKHYSGTVTVTYSKVKTEKSDTNYFMFITGPDIDEDGLKEQMASEGKMYLGYTSFGNGVGKYAIHYLDLKEYNKVIDADSEADAIAAAKAELKESAYGVEFSAEEKTDTVYTYGYEAVAAYVKAVKSEGKTISTEEWARKLGTATIERRNDNWYEGNILLAEYANYGDASDYTTDVKVNGQNVSAGLDEGEEAVTREFRNKVDNAKAVADMYLSTSAKAQAALDDINTAKASVRTLTNTIKALEASDGDLTKINELSAKLTAARAELDAAKQNRDNLISQLRGLENDLNNKIADLTRTDDTGNDDQTPGAPAGDDVTTPVVTTPAAGAAPAVAAAGPAVVDIAEEGTPLVAEAPATAEKEIVEEKTPTAPAAQVEIAENATPTAPAVDETAKPSWLWLLIILILGTTGAEMYRRNVQKKKALKAEAAENNNNNI